MSSLTVASWPAYRFLKRQVRGSGHGYWKEINYTDIVFNITLYFLKRISWHVRTHPLIFNVELKSQYRIKSEYTASLVTNHLKDQTLENYSVKRDHNTKPWPNLRSRPQALQFISNMFPVLAIPLSLWDLSSPTRDWALATCVGGMESQPLDHQGSLHGHFLKQK